MPELGTGDDKEYCSIIHAKYSFWHRSWCHRCLRL